MNEALAIRVNGSKFLDIEGGSVSWSLESFARSFSVTISEKWLRNPDTGFLPFRAGDPAEIFIYGTKVVDGIIKGVPIDYNGEGFQNLVIQGQSWTGLLVKSAAIYKNGSWRDATLKTICENICEPFGVGVKVDPEAAADVSKPFRRWAIEDEETAFACMARAANMRGVFLTTDAGRNIVITKASKRTFPDRVDVGAMGRAVSARREERFHERHSDYIVKSQSAGDDNYFADESNRGFFRVSDPQVEAYSPMVIVSDGSGTREELRLRAFYERNVRAGRSRRLFYKFPNFRSQRGKGPVWETNRLVPIKDQVLEVSGSLLIVRVTFSLSDSEETTELELGAAEAFDVLIPPPERKRFSRRSKKTDPLW